VATATHLAKAILHWLKPRRTPTSPGFAN